MKYNSKSPPKNQLLSLKTVIRTKNLKVSKEFYTQILNLIIVEEYNDGDGSKGCIMRIGDQNSNAFIELSEIDSEHYYYQDSFSNNVQSDKIDLQIKTNDVNHWAAWLNEKWEVRGPVLRPWGSQYLYLRDPDGLQIIIYQEKSL
ncbi:MAG: VOC family protein [Cytophagales bacterium]